jgi:carbon-monoxide dehydrogenase large subunit
LAAHFVRSPHAFAKIERIDTAAAKSAPGVVAVLTGDDLDAEHRAPLRSRLSATPTAPMLCDCTRSRARTGALRRRPVALVIAETLAQAKDAAEQVAVDYDPLPSVTATADASRPGAPAVWDECPDNISNVFDMGDKAATEAAFARAAHVVRGRYVVSRVHAQFMEPRGALGVWDPGEERYTLYADVQYPHRVRNALAGNIFKIPEHQIRVIAGDVGGAFGTKGWQYVEHRLVLWAARKLGRPVKWRCERREAIPADEHARDNVTDAELALDAQGRFLALRVRTLANVGAYVSSDRNLWHVRPHRYDGAPRDRCRARGSAVRDDARESDRAVSRQRPARVYLRDRAPDRRRGARAEDRPGRAPAQEPDPCGGDALQERVRVDLRHGRLRADDGPRARRRRSRRLPAPRGGTRAIPAASRS